MQAPFVSLKQHRSFGDTLSLIIDYLRSAFRPLIQSLISIAGPFILAQVAIDIVFGSPFSFDTLTALEGEEGGVIASALVSILASIAVYIACYSFLTLSHSLGRYPSATEVRERSRSMIGPSIAAALGAVFVLFIGASVLIIPMIWLIVPVTLSFSVVFEERTPFWTSLKRAMYLSKWRWWWTLGVSFLPNMIWSAVAALFAAVTIGILSLGTSIIPGVDESGILYRLAAGILNGIAQCVSYFGTVIATTSSMAAYYHHVERLEATTLTERVIALTNEQQD